MEEIPSQLNNVPQRARELVSGFYSVKWMMEMINVTPLAAVLMTDVDASVNLVALSVQEKALNAYSKMALVTIHLSYQMWQV